MTDVMRRNFTRRWKIICKNGQFFTLSMKRSDADEVARWCDQNHPDCRPHHVTSRETRTWLDRKGPRKANA